MGTDGNATASANKEHERNNLETINGIGRTFSAALHQVGIHRFADLAGYTPDELSKVLLEQTGKRVPPQRIEAKNWIDQARILAEQAKAERTLPEEQVEGVEEAPNHPAWHQRAGFSVFFDYVTDEHGDQVWQTRVYHGESGEEMQFSGYETNPWVNWILEQADLPATPEPFSSDIEAAEEPILSEAEPEAPPTPVTTYDAGLRVLDVQVSKTEPWSGAREKTLTAKIRFEVTGGDAETLTADRIPFWIQVAAVDLASGSAHLAGWERGQLQPQETEYKSELEFPIPELGRYELQSLVLLPPPVERMALHHGPTFRVVP